MEDKKNFDKKEIERKIKKDYARAGKQILDIINKKENKDKER